MGLSHFTAIETAITVGVGYATNYLLVGAAFEVGVGIGSIINAAITPCEETVRSPETEGCK